MSEKRAKIVTDWNSVLRNLWVEFGHPEDIKQVIVWRYDK